MIGYSKEFSPLFEISLFKRDSLGNIKENEPKEHYSSNNAEEIFDFYERKVGFLIRKKELAEAREHRKKEKKKKKNVLMRTDLTRKHGKSPEKPPEESAGRSILSQQKLEMGTP